jgi:hypothetical protein
MGWVQMYICHVLPLPLTTTTQQNPWALVDMLKH